MDGSSEGLFDGQSNCIVQQQNLEPRESMA